MIPRLAAALLCLSLWFAAATDYIPAFLDSEGRVFGLFKLDIYKDALHIASGAWAFCAAALSRRVSKAIPSRAGACWHCCIFYVVFFRAC